VTQVARDEEGDINILLREGAVIWEGVKQLVSAAAL
jgi:hypothetical protein